MAVLYFLGVSKRRLAKDSLIALISSSSEALFLVFLGDLAWSTTAGEESSSVLSFINSAGAVFSVLLVLLIVFGTTRLWLNSSLNRLAALTLADLRFGVVKEIYDVRAPLDTAISGSTLDFKVTALAVEIARNMRTMIDGFHSALTLVIFVFFAMTVSVSATSLTVLLSFAILLVLAKTRSRISGKTRERIESEDSVSTWVEGVVSVHSEVTNAGFTDALLSKSKTEFDQASENWRKQESLSMQLPVVYSLLTYVTLVIILATLAVIPESAVGAVASVVLIFLRAQSYGGRVQNGLVARKQLTEAVRAVTGVTPEVEGAPLSTARSLTDIGTSPAPAISRGALQTLSARDRNGDRAVDGPGPLLAVSGLMFAYPGSKKTVFKELTFSGRRGEIIGLYGSSGSGKSTVGQLLTGALMPLSGTVTVLGRSVSSLEDSDRRKLIGYLPQSPGFVSGSILENFRLLYPEADESQIHAICESVGLGDRLAEIDIASREVLGSRRSDLSGGQLQRLALARLLLRKPLLAVLDEPTSALDSAASNVVIETLKQCREESVLVVITHSTNVLEVCDQAIPVEPQFDDWTTTEKSRRQDFPAEDESR